MSNAFEGPVCFRSCCLTTRKAFFSICGILGLLNAALDILYTSTTVYVMRWLFYGSIFFLIVRIALTVLIGHCWYRYYITNHRQSFFNEKSDRRGSMHGAPIREDIQGDDDDNDEEVEVDEKGNKQTKES